MILGAKWAVDLWLAPVLAGLVAVAVSRASAFIERRAWQRDIRRDVYARFMRAATKLRYTLMDMNHQEERGQNEEALALSKRSVLEYDELSAVAGEVRLFGSEKVYTGVAQVTLRLADPDTRGDIENWLAELSRLMKADLQ